MAIAISINVVKLSIITMIKLSTILTLTTALIIPWQTLAQNPSATDNLLNSIIPHTLTNKSTLLAQKQDNRQRVALVIGNANYQNSTPLNNPVNDANGMAAKLKEVGFEVVLLTNGNLQKMDQALDKFYQKLKEGSVGLFYYAGHGMQVNGENYLLPIDATLKSESDVRYQTLPLGRVLDKMYEAKSEVRIVILDACRDNPFARNWKNRNSANTRGLAQVQSNGEGEFIAYATEPGNVSQDGSSNNGTFTSYVLKYLTTQNKSIEDIFKLVRQGVAQETNKEQVPFITSGLISDFYFNTTVASNSSPPPTTSNPKPSILNNPFSLTLPNPKPTNSTPPNNQTAYNNPSDVVNYVLSKELTDYSEWVKSVAFSADGQHLAGGNWWNSTIKIWNVNSGKLERTLGGHSGSVRSVAFSADGQHLASGSFDNTIKIWNVNSGNLERTLTVHSGSVSSVAFSADGQHLASGSLDKTIKIWNVNSGNLERTLTGTLGVVWSVAFSADGQHLASGSYDKTIKIWNVNSGNLERTLTGHSGSVWSVAFSADGQHLASGSSDKTIKIWNVNSGKLERTLTGHSDSVNSVAFSADGQHLASGSRDNTIRIWQKQ